MDSSGNWHNDARMKNMLADIPDETGERGEKIFPVIEFGIGEPAEVATTAGDVQMCRFIGAEKNRITLSVDYSNPVTYLEFGSTVELRHPGQSGVKASVWDNRGGLIILRTMPV